MKLVTYIEMHKILVKPSSFQSRTLAKKIRESEDYNDPSDYDTDKFKKMGKFAAAFSSRDIKNMTGVNFADVLNDGGLQAIDFPKDSVSIGYRNSMYIIFSYQKHCYDISAQKCNKYIYININRSKGFCRRN